MKLSIIKALLAATALCAVSGEALVPAFGAEEKTAEIPAESAPEVEESLEESSNEEEVLPFGEGIKAWSNRDYDLALNIFKVGAEKGSAPAMTALGYMYTTGNGAPLDQKLGIHWYKMAIAAGEPYALYALSVYLRAYPEMQDHEGESTELLIEAVRKKLPAACQEYFRILEQTGQKEESQKLLLESLEDGQLWAVTVRGIQLVNGDGADKDVAAGLEMLKTAADRGETSALYHAARAEISSGNEEQGEKHHLEAVKHGYAPSMYELGKIYVARGDVAKGRQFLEDAGLNGFTPAYIQLGRIYEEGKSATQDLVQAARYYKMAADVEDPAGCNEYGRMVELGRGVKQSQETAYDLYASGAMGGCPEALFNQGRLELYGIGTEKNVKSGLAKMHDSSNLGCAHATAVLAGMYRTGTSVTKDLQEAEKYYDLAAAQGDSHALFYIARELMNTGDAEKYEEAVEMFRKAADADYYPAQFALATTLADDAHHAPDLVSALSLYTSAAEAGYPPAMCAMGLFKLGAARTDAEAKNAENQIIAAAEAGYLPAEYVLGQIYEMGSQSGRDIRNALQHYKRAAEGGDVMAQIRLASIALNGEFGTAQNPAEAFKYYTLAAEAGDATAQTNLALLYLTGRGTPRDDQKAFAWYEKAAENGSISAKYNLAMMKMHAVGTWKNMEDAIKLLQECAESGYSLAQNELGLLYARGMDVPRSFENARLMFAAAADGGHIPAYYNLGLLYTYSPEGERDPAAAISCFEQAATHGHAKAAWHLGSAYEEGRGVEKDLLRARQYYLVAEAGGEKRAKDALKRIKSALK